MKDWILIFLFGIMIGIVGLALSILIGINIGIFLFVKGW